jgi:hypothetical protein
MHKNFKGKPRKKERRLNEKEEQRVMMDIKKGIT